MAYAGAVLVFPDATRWRGTRRGADAPTGLAPVVAHGGIEILLLGLRPARARRCRRRCARALKARGIVVDAMDTGAACRTYNVLLAEDRRVAAALLPPV